MAENLRDRPIEELVAEVQGLAAVASQAQIQSIAALAARCTIDVSESLNQVSGGIFDAKRQLLERLDTTTQQLAKTSTEASAQTAAMVRWTKVLVCCTIAYTVITGGLLVVAIMQP